MDDYRGPERREPSVQNALGDLAMEVRRLARLIEGENGRIPINRGVIGAIDDLTHTEAKLDVRVSTLETQWQRAKWTIIGAAAGGGLLGGVAFDGIRHVVGL